MSGLVNGLQNRVHPFESGRHLLNKAVTERVRKYILRHNLLRDDMFLLVALSGGADSVFLLRVLLRLGYRCEAVHCNFHLRGDESMRDEHFVRNLCKKLDVPLHVRDFDTTSYAEANHKSIELAARELRYSYFDELRTSLSADAIAVAHHRDDNVETMLWNLVRGTGLRGLRGMLPRNGAIVRPLLCVGKAEIVEALNDIGQDYVTDSTNLLPDCTRNRIRLQLLPMLRSLNPAADANMATMMDNLLEVGEIFDSAVCNFREQVTLREQVAGSREFLTFDLKRLMQTPAPRTVLYEIVSPYGFTRDQVENMLSAENGKEFFSKDRTVKVTKTRKGFSLTSNL